MKLFIFLCLKSSVLLLLLLSLCVLPNCQAKETISTTSSTSATSSVTSSTDNAKVTGSTGAISNTESSELKLVSIKPKRDAALSLGGGGGGGGYHGPSHKYLPPTTLSGIQYQYQPHHHHHGNTLSSTSGFDFGNLDESNYHQHHHQHHQHHHDDHHHHHYQDQHQHHYAQAYLTPVYEPNKFETYIVQSEHGSGSNGAHGYKYVAPALSHHHHHVTEKPHKSYILSSVDHYQPQTQHQINYGTYVHNKPISTHSHGHSAHGSSSNGGYHYAPVVEHVDHDHDHHHHQSQQIIVSATNSLSPYLSGTIHGHAGQGGINAGIGFSAGLGGKGYQYDIPHSPYQAIARKPQVLTSYGLPVAVAAAADEPRHQQHHVHQTITTATATAATQHQRQHEHNTNNDDDDVGTPAYAVGHKGLGHFSYVSSKPHAAFHSDIAEVSVAPHQALIGEQQHYDTHTLAEISKAPFKPSAFLGAKHEITGDSGGTSAVGGDISIYETSAAAAAAQQYMPPTSLDYEYQAPTVLYGAPTHSGDSAAPIYEPVEATYLPSSATSAAAAGAASTTNGNYLPPTQH